MKRSYGSGKVFGLVLIVIGLVLIGAGGLRLACGVVPDYDYRFGVGHFVRGALHIPNPPTSGGSVEGAWLIIYPKPFPEHIWELGEEHYPQYVIIPYGFRDFISGKELVFTGVRICEVYPNIDLGCYELVAFPPGTHSVGVEYVIIAGEKKIRAWIDNKLILTIDPRDEEIEVVLSKQVGDPSYLEPPQIGFYTPEAPKPEPIPTQPTYTPPPTTPIETKKPEESVTQTTYITSPTTITTAEHSKGKTIIPSGARKSDMLKIGAGIGLVAIGLVLLSRKP